ncbi:hypothetical protein ACH5RR_037399 [Cinchona calisaya]|uniref:RRM domain-containing protein n=1 Tax=Cinchona calisaya TaxID=153742 RepID=A0ABD2Y9S5_9GENT
MSGRGGRDRFRKEYPSRSEEKGHHGRNNPPSRHLWVGNLSHNLDESSLAHHFLRFGELESIAFQSGRSYAFVNFKNEEDAFAAIRELQGFSVAGNPLRIEFTKAEKSTPQRDDKYSQRRDEHHSTVRGSPFSQRDSRVRHSSPDSPYPDKSKIRDKNGEPSEVLWIGFPAQLKVDEFILRKAFAPFGEIDRITAFPGRSYAFVRFKNVMAACRAKETLQGKLFGNPRVHLCFAKSESGTSNRERNSISSPQSPQFRSRVHASENSRQDRDFGNLTGDFNVRSPLFMENFEPSDHEVMSFGRKNDAWAGGNGGFEQRYRELGSERDISGNIYEHHGGPPRNGGPHLREFAPEIPRQGPFDDDPFDLPEDSLLFHGAKKLKTSSFAPENELPEYPFSDSGQAKRIPSRAYPDFHPDAYDKNTDAEPFGYKKLQNLPIKSTQIYEERNDLWSAPYDGFQMVSAPLPSHPERTRSAPESQQAYVNKEWKWEGTIAKGGTPVCRARCFPVGKLMDMVLPEFLDCTARTSLDMLAKHYYQAAGAWVVFFVPASDPDIALYNEFMNYLGEKQRAAVAKLDDRSTLFLVPPSDFSEKVLKVPGKMSISGVVLRLEHPGSSFGSIHQQEKKEANFTSFHGTTSMMKTTSPSGLYPNMPTLPDFEGPGVRNASFTGNFSLGPSPASFSRPDVRNTSGNLSDSIGDTRHGVGALHQHRTVIGPNWSPHDIQNLNSNIRNVAPETNSMVNSINEGYNPVPVSRTGNQPLQEKPPALPSAPFAALQPEQLVQLASTFLGQRRHSGAVATGTEWAQQNYVPPPNSQVGSEISSSQYGQIQQLQHQVQQQQLPNVPAMPQVNQPQQNAGEEEGDTEKRLQTTLQLAAALLQQIQQGKGT